MFVVYVMLQGSLLSPVSPSEFKNEFLELLRRRFGES